MSKIELFNIGHVKLYSSTVFAGERTCETYKYTRSMPHIIVLSVRIEMETHYIRFRQVIQFTELCTQTELL